MKKEIIIILVGILTISSCKNEVKISKDISENELNLRVSRFDREFAESTPKELPDLKRKYSFLFPEQYPDSVWYSKQQDSLQMELYKEVMAVFSDLESETQELELLFKHIQYYFPKYQVPWVITLISDVDYQNRVILTDSILLIGLDNYLGEDHRFYGGIDRYIAAGLDKNNLISDVTSAFSNKLISYPKDRVFLAQMIYYGKELYLKDMLIPLVSDAIKIGYSEEDLLWAEANEEQIWRYFIENELLYSTDYKLSPRFLDPAPFSKFGLELDNESPGKIGRYMGWQIVRSFMENNELSLSQLIALPADDIFKRSKYKPRK